ncbi:HIT family protein [Streptomyces sp. NPDC057298]|uniref:HIT family protein n=1 Tax=Streptomyces sp. NPDC057298 TaxID=3346091 RepID=UPI003624FC3A
MDVLPGGTVLRTPLWVVEHCVGPLPLGTLVVKPLRHVLHVADLTPDESAELGPLLRRVTTAVTAVTCPEQVYVCLWSHAGAVPGHIHFVVQPALTADLERYGAYGPALQTAMFAGGAVPDVAAVAGMCERLRAEPAVSGAWEGGGVERKG